MTAAAKANLAATPALRARSRFIPHRLRGAQRCGSIYRYSRWNPVTE